MVHYEHRFSVVIVQLPFYETPMHRHTLRRSGGVCVVCFPQQTLVLVCFPQQKSHISDWEFDVRMSAWWLVIRYRSAGPRQLSARGPLRRARPDTFC